MYQEHQVVRHFLAALAYRLHRAIADARTDYPAYSAGGGVRTPHALLRHINGVLHYGLIVLRTANLKYKGNLDTLAWPQEIERFHSQLKEMDEELARNPTVDPELLKRLLQGPLADAMTHVGQLAMLRRLAGAPVAAENFLEADIRAGVLGADQPPAISPDE